MIKKLQFQQNIHKKITVYLNRH